MRDYYSSTCYRVTSRAAEQLRPVDQRKLENIMKVSKLHRMKLNFSRSTLLHTKTRVSLKYPENDCRARKKSIQAERKYRKIRIS